MNAPQRIPVSLRFAQCVGWLTLFVASATLQAAEPAIHSFERKQLTDVYFSEGANAGDINSDGVTDVVYGPYWFAGPEFKDKREIYPAVPQDKEGYADNFFNWVYDFNQDGGNDVLVVGFPGTPAYVYENPKKDHFDKPWVKHEVFDWVSNESPQFVQLVGDDRPELVCTRDGFFGYAVIDWSKPFEAWKFHAISARIADERFGHGLGVGDVNSDGRMDVIHPSGWFEQPASLDAGQRWPAHEASFTDAYGGAEMYAYDVDGDGDNDVITSLAAHDFGLAWYEQLQEEGKTTFRQHPIMGKSAAENDYGVVFSELHSVNLVDMDGDGLRDIVTGKTFYSHHQQSPMWDAGAVVYWFKLVRGQHGVEWIPFKADGESGIGRQLSIADVNKDGLSDIVVGGMKGAHVLVHQAKTVSQDEWNNASPKKVSATASPGPTGQSNRGPKAKLDGVSGKADGAIEGESIKGVATGGAASPQEMSAFTADRWSGASQLWWTGAKVGDSLKLPLPKAKGKIDLELVLTCAPDYGVVQISIDDHPLGGPIDLYDREVITTGVLTFEDIELKNGEHELKVEIVGVNPKAIPFYMFGLDYLSLRTEDGAHIVPLDTDVSAAAAIPQPLVNDEYPLAGVDAEQAAAAMKTPKGFRVIVGASEPDIQQPIAMALDDRGRVWVAEAYEYPQRAQGDVGRDRILIFEDTDQNGSLDKRTIFAEGLNLVSGIEVGFGGVWVGAAPYLLFIPDKDHDDKPDGKPQVLLDGWAYEDTHETLNTFIWGPDGWLYGCHGVFTHSNVGKPGAPDDKRQPINAGIWRYHPTRHEFEVFAHGTSNPWGVDFDDHGQAFCTACVIPHLYHVIPGGRYQRQAGVHFNSHTYEDIQTIADHRHYLGANPHGGNDKSDAAGGGHAHSGAMIYLGGKWPLEYRNKLFMNNIHGQRLNMDVLTPQGSGYVGSHGPDFLLAGDRASQILNVRYGPDGDAWMIDWYDMQACHLQEIERHDRSNGRIYKVVYDSVDKPAKSVDLPSLSDLDLAKLYSHDNDWYVRHTRRLLQERAVERPIDANAVDFLTREVLINPLDTKRLRAFWALHAMNRVSASVLDRLYNDESPYVRAWFVRLLVDQAKNRPSESTMSSLAEREHSPIVRLSLASVAQRIPVEQRWSLIQALVTHPEDADDHNLPLMYWYAMEPLAEVDERRALELGLFAGKSIPKLRDLMLRRIGGASSEASLELLVNALDGSPSQELTTSLLTAIHASLEGKRSAIPPRSWTRAAQTLMKNKDDATRLQASAIGVVFGDAQALKALQDTLGNFAAPAPIREIALQALLKQKDSSVPPVLASLISSPNELRTSAIRACAEFDNAELAEGLLAQYQAFTQDEKRLALETLCSRPSSALALLDSVEKKNIPGVDLTGDLIRQLRYLKSDDVNAKLKAVWGEARDTAADKLAMIKEFRALAEDMSDPAPDVQLGRAMFAQTCQKCHMLYGVGAKVGPDLTGSNRSDLDYLLTNIADPSAVMAKEYRPTVVVVNDGRVITGLIRAEDDRTLTLQTAESMHVLAKADIEERLVSDKSMMPEDQLKAFSKYEIRSLFAYLRGKRQNPMLASERNADALFNGIDLTGWIGEESLWTVENGEIVGRAAGLDHNEWLASELAVKNFELKLEVKLVDNAGNSGIQFRSERRDDGEVAGYQADIGEGWWGKLYEEHGRGLLWDKSGEPHVKPGEWNHYLIRADGRRITTSINGNTCVDVIDPDGASRGVIAFQLHSGGATEVRIRNIELKILPDEAASLKE